MAVEVGMGYVSLVPEVQGFAGELQRQVTGPSEAAGQEGGQTAGEGFTGKMGGVLKAGLAAVGVAAAAVLAKGFMDALDQTAINGKIQAQLGSTPAEAKRYGEAAGQLYAHGITDSVEDAAGVIRSVMESGIAPPDATNAQLESVAGKSGNLAEVFDQDVGGVTRAVSQLLRTGMVKSADEAFDILTRGFQNGSNKADDLLDTLNEYSTQFRKLGLDGETSLGLISQMVQAGARDSDIAADALKEFSIRVVDGSKTTADGFAAIGLNADEMAVKFGQGGKTAAGALDLTIDRLRAMRDPVAQGQAAVALFGTQSEDLGKALFAMDPSTAVKAMGETAGAADRMGDALHNHNNASAKIEQCPARSPGRLVRRFRTAHTAVMALYGAIYGALAPVFTNLALIFTQYLYPAAMRIYTAILENLQPILAELAKFVTTRVVPAVQMIGQKLSDLVQKAQPVISVVSTIITWVAQLAAKILGAVIPVMLRLAGPVFSALFSALGTGIDWIGNVIGFVGKLGTAFVNSVRDVAEFGQKSRQKIGEFTDWMRGLPGRIGKALGSFGRLLVDKGADLVRGLWEGVRNMGGWLRDKLISWAKSAIPGPIADALGINSPSTLMRDQIGKWIPAGVIDGIDQGQRKLDARVRMMVQTPSNFRVPKWTAPAPKYDPTQHEDFWDFLTEVKKLNMRDIVLRVGEQDLARVAALGKRQLDRR